MDQGSVYNLYRRVVVTTRLKTESTAFIGPRGRAASWYTSRAYLEKHLPYSIDELSRKNKTEH